MKRPLIIVAASMLLCGCAVGVLLRIQVEDVDSTLKVFEGGVGAGNSTVFFHPADQALMVDTKYRVFSHQLHSRVEEDLAAHVRRIVLTHAHNDHAGGLDLYSGVTAVLVHPNAKKRLAAAGDPRAFVEVEREERLMLDGEEVQVLNIGSGHTDGDLVALFPTRKLVVAGDLVNEGIEPYCDPEYGGDILVLSHTLPELMKLDFDRLVPGHGAVMPRAKVQKLTDYVVALEAKVRDAQARGLTEDQTANELKFPEYPLDEVLFVTSRAGNIRAMYRALERKAVPVAGSR